MTTAAEKHPASVSMPKPPYPLQHQDKQPGIESVMNPRPIYDDPNYKPGGKLKNKVAIITGGDSGQGRAIAVAFAKEGADVVIVYLNEHSDAEETKQVVEQKGRKCLCIAGDLGQEAFCKQIVEQTVTQFGRLDILVNNAAEQHIQDNFESITSEQMERTFRTNFFSVFYLTKAALPNMKKGSSIINAASLTAYEGNEQLIDYSATKGAIVAFTRSLSKSLHSRGIRVEAYGRLLFPHLFLPLKSRSGERKIRWDVQGNLARSHPRMYFWHRKTHRIFPDNSSMPQVALL
ncbi:putative oxidoreductase YhxC [Paenibacillus alvei DSM 29]|nr:putative oxidoreductase YhxC [Paenibacillus alvei DSM 29]